MELKETFFKTKILSLFFSRAAWQQFHFSCVQYFINSALRRSWCDCVVVDDHHALMRSSRGNELGVTAQVPVSRFVTHHHLTWQFLFLPHPFSCCVPASQRFFSFLSDGETTRRKKEKSREKKVQKRVSVSPSSAPAAFYGEFERKQEKRLPRTLLRTPLPSSHIASFTHSFHSPVFSRLHVRTRTRMRPKVKSALLIAVSGLVELQNKALHAVCLKIMFQ